MIALKCGVAGVGYLGQHHARLYAALPQTELVGVYDVDARRAKKIAAEHGTRVFSSLEELGAACDAVSVVAPTDYHCAVAQTLLAQGCHLLIEKPLCSNLEEAEIILAAAKQHERIVQVGHIEHFNPVMSFLEKNVTDPRFITCDRLAPFKQRGLEVSVVLDLMIHDIGVILQLVKSPLERVDAVGVEVLTKTEDIANARLTFANGCVANINASRVSLKPVREIRVFQSNAYLSLNFAEQKGHLIRKTKLGLRKKNVPIEKGEPLALELAAFAEAIQTRVAPKVDGQLGKTALEVALQVTAKIKESAAKGK
ncbi:Gfo/Idh/MocA family protein [Cerasicoccus arenae]|uniref:UDP-N-acetylglucosamine 3-dehydrogenase n=1 Tax=Cerasicoccus arenae TaxID=424488 RepID=A0A8J3GDS2_9BACT|nr:Gfo/Idh/MocA family oxidoreductase [Cerasicoccus arenae]MBK1859125.1 Gfo/Idh/MocA family oxidoreductase [Cerasicoccus arenae]GHB97985.1 UDP-N-acetylglucosamine 3-dehydrogenase [Cerasicoccus arenae]